MGGLQRYVIAYAPRHIANLLHRHAMTKPVEASAAIAVPVSTVEHMSQTVALAQVTELQEVAAEQGC